MKSLRPGVILLAAIILIALLAVFLGSPHGSSPTLPSTPAPISGASQIHYGSYIVRIGIITILLIAVIVIMARWYKKSLFPRGPQGLSVEILGKAYLGNRQQLVMAKVADAFLLMGVTDQSVSVLKEFQPDDIPEQLKTVSRQAGSPVFSDWLKKMLHKPIED